MAEPFLPEGVERPDFYIAAMGRSGSTLLCNWLTNPPDQLVFVEPSFLNLPNTRLLRIQLENLGVGPSDEEWNWEDRSSHARFQRLMNDRLAGKRWALKEVLCSEHRAILDQLMPRRALVSVRNIRDVALSFFEKHRLQGNLHRFDDQWVVDYCVREASGLLTFLRELRSRAVPLMVVRYEDFTSSEQDREQVANFVGWRGGGATDAHLNQFDRAFEVERHGNGVSSRNLPSAERDLGTRERSLADHILERCSEYQRTFGYDPEIYSNVNIASKLVYSQ